MEYKIKLLERDNARLKTLLYNAITLLVDETLDSYVDEDRPTEWLDMMCRELGCTLSELKEYGGINVDVNGNIEM